MNMKIVFLLLMLLIIAWETFLEILDRRSVRRPIPVCVSDVYDPGEYRKWRAYKGESDRLSEIHAVVTNVIGLAMLAFDGYAAFARLFPAGLYSQLWAVVLLSCLLETVVGLPFSAYSTFRIEEKYGFNRSTGKTFLADAVKEFVISLLLIGGLVSLFAVIYRAAGDLVIVLFAAAIVLFGLLLTLLAPVLTRLYNTFRPLEDGELKDRLTKLMTSHGYKVRAIEVMDASRRSTRMNAYFTGFGPMKTIVLYDTLVAEVSPDQLCAIFAHELGHGLHHDTLKTQVISVFTGLIVAVCAWLVVRSGTMFADFGFTEVNYGMAFVLMSVLLGVLQPLMSLLSSLHSRSAEYKADAQAVREGYGRDLISALKLLSKKNMANLSPDPLVVRLTYSHPTLAQRIEAIEKQME